MPASYSVLNGAQLLKYISWLVMVGRRWYDELPSHFLLCCFFKLKSLQEVPAASAIPPAFLEQYILQVSHRNMVAL
jgi:hypothetical protein